MNVETISNNSFNSTTNILTIDNISKDRWLIDCANAAEVIRIFNNERLVLKGIFLTHAHFDHILGLKELIECFPEAIVYTSEIGLGMLQNARRNMSYYWGNPIVFDKTENVRVVEDNNCEIPLNKEHFAKAIFTPGHNPSCITWIVEDAIFTGDSYIPDIKTVTNLPGGNRAEAARSEELIKQLAIGRRIFPGHKVEL